MTSSSVKRRGLRLERTIGLTALHNTAVDVSPSSGDVAYPAGCIVVIYSPAKNRQVAFMRATKAISSLRYSGDGQLLAVGERGHHPSVTVWDMTQHRRLVELKGHRFGVSCLAFSPNHTLLVSVGFRHDHGLSVWDWARGLLLYSHKLSAKVFSVDFAASGMEFVTVGECHVRFWECHTISSTHTSAQENPQCTGCLSEHRAALMPAYRKACFVDVRCGRGNLAGTTLAVTSCGLLVSFGPSRLMEKWVELETPRAFAISLATGILACSCHNGVVRLFDPATLGYISTVPRPPPTARGNGAYVCEDNREPTALEPEKACAAALCARLDYDGRLLSVVYDDRSFFVWDAR